jgi:DNA repair protein RadD
MINYRHYQSAAISAAMNAKNGVCVLPTGSGKSVICAGIVDASDGGVLVLQPSLEILESNLLKAALLGIDAEVYSASAGKKTIGKVTYATIGSIIKKLELFSHVDSVIIDECHLVNAKGGMYEQLITSLAPKRLIGLTATPYRLSTNSFGASMKIITRTRPKLFDNILHVTNPSDLVAEGFLMEPEYIAIAQDESMLRPNTTGAEFTESSQIAFAKNNNIKSEIVSLVSRTGHNHYLVFIDSVDESKMVVEMLIAAGISAAEINALTPKNERRENLQCFQNGSIRVMVNVGTLTTGYDFPALDCIIDAGATMSAALHYQKIGRVVRHFSGKNPVVYCMAGNVRRLGSPLKYTMLKTASGKGYEVYSENGRVTTRIMTGQPEQEEIIRFGKHSGKRLGDIDSGYIEWAAENLKGETKNLFYAEKVRRELFGSV